MENHQIFYSVIGKAAATAIGCDGSDWLAGPQPVGGITLDNNTEARWPQPTAAAAVKYQNYSTFIISDLYWYIQIFRLWQYEEAKWSKYVNPQMLVYSFINSCSRETSSQYVIRQLMSEWRKIFKINLLVKCRGVYFVPKLRGEYTVLCEVNHVASLGLCHKVSRLTWWNLGSSKWK